MRSAYVVPYGAGVVALTQPVMDQLGLEESSILYALTIPKEHSVVLSPIPIDRWDIACRLTVYTTGGVGRLAAVTRALSDMKINLLMAWSAATSPDGQLCITAIIENLESDSTKIMTDLMRRLGSETLEGTPLLMESGLFGQDGLEAVQLSPLSFLRTMSLKFGNRPRYRLHINNLMINLEQKSIAGDGGELLAGLQPDGARPTRFALISPDTEERYLRLSLIDDGAVLRRITFPIEVQSPVHSFAGYFQAAAEALAQQRCNLFAARDILLRKTGSDGAVSAETARLSFLADVSSSQLGGATNPDPTTFRNNLIRPLKEAVENHRAATDASARVLIEWNRELIVETLREIGPLCFFATNVTEASGELLDYARQVFSVLLHLGLQPVQVDVAQSESILNEARELIEICPALVSFHVPDEKNEMRTGEYSPSDWVSFEEACMLERRRRIFPVRHKKVRQSNYRRQIREWDFESKLDIDKICKELKESILRHMMSVDWKRAVAETAPLVREKVPLWVDRTMSLFWVPAGKSEREDC